MRSRLFFLCSALVGMTTCCAAAVAEYVPTDFQPNYDQGYQSGYSTGYDLGLVTGKARGTTEGTTTGHSDGYNFGWNETYQPAFDQAYDAKYPVAHRDGWDAGVTTGVSSGFEWEKSEYERWLSEQSGSITMMDNFSGAGIFMSSGSVNMANWNNFAEGNLSASDYTVWRSNFGSNYDLAGHFYNVGFADGKGIGTTTGDTAGYGLAYPIAYAAAYKTGYVDGTGAGTQQGTIAGGKLGTSDGWSAGNGVGYDVGFDAGVNYFLFGKLVLPKYAFDGVPSRSDFPSSIAFSNFAPGSVAQSSATPTVPEPSSLMLVAIAAGFGLLWRRG